MVELSIIKFIWLHALLGTVLALVGCGLGWSLAQHPSLLLVRITGWWVRRIAHPLIACRSWWRRSSIIFANNGLMMGLVVASGFARFTSLLAVAWLGVSLGIAFRKLESLEFGDARPDHQPPARNDPRVTVGVLLNLLEPPAIMLAIGLSLGWKSVPLTAMQVWSAYLELVIPLILLAACGEALWLGVRRRSGLADGSNTKANDRPASESDKKDFS